MSASKRRKYKKYFEPSEDFSLPNSTRRRLKATSELSGNAVLLDQVSREELSSELEDSDAGSNTEEVASFSVGYDEVNRGDSHGELGDIDTQSITEELAVFSAHYEEHYVGDQAGNNESDSEDSLHSFNQDDQDDDDDDTSDDEPEEDPMGLFGMDESLNETVLPNCATTKGEAVLMIMTFAMRHNLSSIGLVHLLKLVNQILGQNSLSDTKYLFQKIFHSRSVHLTFHFYCTFCTTLVGAYYEHGADNVPCPQCYRPCDMSNLSSDNFFISSEIKPQLESLFQNPSITPHLDYRFLRRKEEEGNLEDIYDGEIYQRMCGEGNPLHNRNNFSYSFNTDGVPIFSSSKCSLWPIYIMLNELPPTLRRENQILAGVWCGKAKPKMEIFLQQLSDEAIQLVNDGITWINNGREINSKVFALCCCVDAPARASLQNTVQFNGYYGCSLCYHPGRVYNRVIKYPVDVAPYQERKDDEMLADMVRAVDENRIIRGVKGPTPLINIPYFPIVWGFPPDFMHCCLLGVARQLAEIWLESSSDKEYYIGSVNKIALLDLRISSIKLPSIITRAARPISERKYWKASEWLSWILYCSLPCLCGILPGPYLEHLCSFVEAMFILLQKSISAQSGNIADLLLESFVGQFQALYGPTAMTFNVHSLTHLAKSVKMWGPLWTHSCFPFEASNGQVKKLLHGNKGIPLQAMHKFVLLKALPSFRMLYNISDQINLFCSSMVGTVPRNPTHAIGDTLVFGTGEILNLTEELQVLFADYGVNIRPNVVTFRRMMKRGCIFHTIDYVRAKARNNKYFCLKDRRIGELHYIIIFEEKCFLIFKQLVLEDAVEFADQESGAKSPHIKRWVRLGENYQVVSSDLLSMNCVAIKLMNRSYVCYLSSYCTL